MNIIRNFINIIGLADFDELPVHSQEQLIQYSESENITIPENQPNINSIFEIMIQITNQSTRNVKTPIGHTIIIDGIKKLKIIYSGQDSTSKANYLDLELPFNTFITLPQNFNLHTVDVYILDAYFSLLDTRRIYCHYVFMVNIQTDSHISLAKENNKPILIKAPNFNETNDKQLSKIIQTKKINIDTSQKQSCTPIKNNSEIMIDLDAEHL